MKIKATKTICAILALIMALSVLSACGKKFDEPEIIEITPAPTETAEPSAEMSENLASAEPEETLSEAQISKYITLKNVNVQVGSENINWFAGMNPDSEVIASVSVDDSEVNLGVEGMYNIYFTIIVNKNIFLQKEGLSSEMEEGAESAQTDQDGNIVIESERINSYVTKTVFVLNPTTAMQYVNSGETVLTSNGKYLQPMTINPQTGQLEEQPTQTGTTQNFGNTFDPSTGTYSNNTLPQRTGVQSVTNSQGQDYSGYNYNNQSQNTQGQSYSNTTPQSGTRIYDQYGNYIGTIDGGTVQNGGNATNNTYIDPDYQMSAVEQFGGLPLPGMSTGHRHSWATITMITPGESHQEPIYETYERSGYDETIYSYTCEECGQTFDTSEAADEHEANTGHTDITVNTSKVHHDGGTEQILVGYTTVVDQQEVTKQVTYCTDPTCSEYNAEAAEYARTHS